MQRRLFIIGTNHTLQCGASPYVAKDVDAFRKIIRSTCKKRRIKFIAEEMSDEGLNQKSVSQSVCCGLGTELAVDVEYVDPNEVLRSTLGIGDVGIRLAAIPPGHMSPDKQLEKLFRKELIDNVRESLWLAKILQKNVWPVLFVCGTDHVKSIEKRAKRLKIEAIVIHADYQP